MTNPHPPALRLPRELTIYTAAETRASWLAWLSGDGGHAEPNAQGEPVCRVDGEDVDEVDAAGVQLLVALAHSLQHRQVSLQLCRASGPLRAACHDLGLAALLLGGDAQATAVKAIEPAGAPA